MPKFSVEERIRIKNIVASLSINRLSDDEIIKEIFHQTSKSITRKQIYNVRQQIKKDSYHWYTTMRDSKYEYLHEFKERINEILWLQQYHHGVINDTHESTSTKQDSAIELHRLNITLSNYYDVAPEIINSITLSKTPETEKKENNCRSSSSSPEQEQSSSSSTEEPTWAGL